MKRLKDSLIKLIFDNKISISNPQNSVFDNLPFYSDQRLITGKKNCVDNDIVERLINGFIVNIHANLM